MLRRVNEWGFGGKRGGGAMGELRQPDRLMGCGWMRWGGSSSSEPDNLRNDAKAPGPRTIFILNA